MTPFVRIPPNGGETSQWVAKQVLDHGVYGIVWPHVSTVEEALNAVTACRYPRPRSAAYYEPAGQRGDAPAAAARYWGLIAAGILRARRCLAAQPEGEILVAIMCEEVRAIRNLPKMLEEVPGIGVVIIGEGDLSQDLGYRGNTTTRPWPRRSTRSWRSARRTTSPAATRMSTARTSRHCSKKASAI